MLVAILLKQRLVEHQLPAHMSLSEALRGTQQAKHSSPCSQGTNRPSRAENTLTHIDEYKHITREAT